MSVVRHLSNTQNAMELAIAKDMADKNQVEPWGASNLPSRFTG
jgi:hypothetical protein